MYSIYSKKTAQFRQNIVFVCLPLCGAANSVYIYIVESIQISVAVNGDCSWIGLSIRNSNCARRVIGKSSRAGKFRGKLASIGHINCARSASAMHYTLCMECEIHYIEFVYYTLCILYMDSCSLVSCAFLLYNTRRSSPVAPFSYMRWRTRAVSVGLVGRMGLG